MQMNLTPPPGLRGDERSQLVQMHSFLFQLTEQLNAALTETDRRIVQTEQATGIAPPAAGGGAGDESLAGQYTDLKSLIIKTANVVRSEMNVLVSSLDKKYIAVSDWGTYEEAINRNIVDTAEKTVESFGYNARLDALDDQAAGFESYMVEAKGSIVRGIVDYDEDGLPVFGMAIGQDLSTVTVNIDGVEYEMVDTTQSLATYTASGIAFWQNGAKMASFENSELKCENVSVYSRLKLRDEWEISRTNGFTVKWIGGE